MMRSAVCVYYIFALHTVQGAVPRKWPAHFWDTLSGSQHPDDSLNSSCIVQMCNRNEPTLLDSIATDYDLHVFLGLFDRPVYVVYFFVEQGGPKRRVWLRFGTPSTCT